MDRRGDGSSYVTRAEFRRVVDRFNDRWRRLQPALEFFEAMTQLGLRELLPAILADAQARKVVQALREGRGRRWARALVVLGVVSYVVMLTGSAMAILRTAGLLH